jgi:hypothetical protein
MKTISYLIFALLAAGTANANEKGNGGGGEIHFHSLASQIGSWLRQYYDDGTLAKKLILDEKNISAKNLVVEFEKAVNNTPDVKFIPVNEISASCQSGDAGACLLDKNPSRICVNHGGMDGNYIRCNGDAFNGADGDLQFSIVFHEYLGVAGIEINEESDIQSYSKYPISRYLMQFAIPKTVIRYELGAVPIRTAPSVETSKPQAPRSLTKLGAGAMFASGNPRLLIEVTTLFERQSGHDLEEHGSDTYLRRYFWITGQFGLGKTPVAENVLPYLDLTLKPISFVDQNFDHSVGDTGPAITTAPADFHFFATQVSRELELGKGRKVSVRAIGFDGDVNFWSGPNGIMKGDAAIIAHLGIDAIGIQHLALADSSGEIQKSLIGFDIGKVSAGIGLQLMNPMEHEYSVRLMVGGDADLMRTEGKSISEQSVYSRLSVILPDFEDHLYRGWEMYAQIQGKHLGVPDELNIPADPDQKKLPLFISIGVNGTF